MTSGTGANNMSGSSPFRNINAILRLFARSARLRVYVAHDRFLAEIRGVAAVEFAFIAPIMLLLFVGTMELSSGISVNRKLSRLSSTISDLVTQSQTLTANDVEAIMDVSSQVMYPYTDAVRIVLSGIEIENGVARVIWSKSRPGGYQLSTGTIYTIPGQINRDGTFLVAAKVSTEYSPSFGWAQYNEEQGVFFHSTPIAMEEEIFLRPRIGADVKIN
jgi:Flp pilus assembly protein TadG